LTFCVRKGYDIPTSKTNLRVHGIHGGGGVRLSGGTFLPLPDPVPGRGERTNATDPKAGHIVRRALCVIALFCSTGLTSVTAQEPPPPTGERGLGFKLEQNYPNPFNPDTRIPFELEDALFEEGKPVTVSIRIYNILTQFVAAPVALRHPGGEGLPLLQLGYTSPGRYEAYWDGRDRHGKQVASGVYFVQMRVDDRGPAVRRMFVTK